MHHLFQPLQIGPLTLPNRILMAPLTRCRADSAHVPTELMAEQYAQRASAGLIIAEATMVMEGHCAFQTEPGLYNQAQIDGWRRVTRAVHDRGGRIFVQLWHGGRACHPLLNHGAQPVSASPIAITNDLTHTPEGKQNYVVPRELGDDELPAIVEGFRQAAVNAQAAGFDGIEIHGANGYLLDQFLRDGCNHRTGPYGGSIDNRARLLLEVLQAVCSVWGGERVGLRLSPISSFNSMGDSDPIGLAIWLAKRLNECNLAYLHLIRGDVLGELKGDVLTPVREQYRGVLIANLRYTPEEAETAIAQRQIDAVAFGTSYIANPDLVERIRKGAPLNSPNPSTFYRPGPEGYIDYPFLAA
ncbi:NADH:flavin oxidoreductase/NADH oxidase [Desulfobulbus propionicus DSM 2032]|uniref:NADH:flavin oxidoreductase/NADH oxidase n=1 Tax=Desulfobulbus propionicus (strain ATCC 33891 / DSM 2032 / VKM B-1956 / 1pr3) TaxID=577650 RepID=A0A7U4DPM4_DESPD|nr:alkene reductase [Desulfobulbus propionicus]ADW18301.1 NADH:flavin oxidoreductase/NADH oxidase [Desulfobulbus propionicus DSM 2032]